MDRYGVISVGKLGDRRCTERRAKHPQTWGSRFGQLGNGLTRVRLERVVRVIEKQTVGQPFDRESQIRTGNVLKSNTKRHD